MSTPVFFRQLNAWGRLWVSVTLLALPASVTAEREIAAPTNIAAVEYLGLTANEIPYRSPTALEGDIAAWHGHPFRTYGVDTAAEKLLSGSIYTAWSAEGVAIGLDVVACDPALPATPEQFAIDIFLDERPRTARMDKYETGVRHFQIRAPTSETRRQILLFDTRGEVTDATAHACEIRVKRTPLGWTAECRVRWLESEKKPTSGQVIGLAVRVSRTVLGRTIAIGADTVEPQNRLEDSPIAFTPVKLCESTAAAVGLASEADEVLFQNEPWLRIRVMKRRSDFSAAPGTLSLAASAIGLERQLSFRPSVQGIYEIAEHWEPLDRPSSTGAAIDIRIREGETTLLHRVSCPVSESLRKVEEELPSAAIDNMPYPETRHLAYLLKAAAQEAAALASTSIESNRAPGRIYRSAEQPELYREKIDLFITWCQSVLQGKIDDNFPYRAWRSEIDGGYLPIKVVYPWNHVPGKKYPATVLVYGFNRLRSRAQFMENDLLALKNGEYQPAMGDGFKVVLYGRGNSHLTLGDEELAYVLDKLLPSLGVDPDHVTLYGGSAGATTALQIGLRYPDRFSLIHCRSGDHEDLLGEIKTRGAHRLSNLTGRRVYLETGADEEACDTANRDLADWLQRQGVVVKQVSHPNTGHFYVSPPPPSEFSTPFVAPKPEFVSYETDDLAYQKSSWLMIDALTTPGKSGRVAGHVMDGHLTLTAEGVNSFSIDLSRVPFPSVSLRRLIVNGTRFAFENNAAAFATFTRSAESWTLRELAHPADQNLHRCGPAAVIERRRLIIVYGTKASNQSDLRRRALEIVKARVGTEAGQWGGGHFTVKADIEVKPEIVASHNLWLVGGPEENSLTAQLLPFAASATPDRIKIGAREFSGRDLLVNFVHPLRGNHPAHLYVEMGNSPLAYTGPILPEPLHDLSVHQVTATSTRRLVADDLAPNWASPNE